MTALDQKFGCVGAKTALESLVDSLGAMAPVTDDASSVVLPVSELARSVLFGRIFGIRPGDRV